MLQIIRLLVLALAVAQINGDSEADISPTTGSLPKRWVTEERSGQASRDKLLDELFHSYKTYSYPEKTTVSFGAVLLDVKLDATKNVMRTGIWLRMVWTDNRLTWDPKETGVGLLRVPASKLWLPDITLYNSIEQDHNQRMKCWDSNVIIYSTGQIIWVPPCTLATYCNLTLSEDPYAEQKCILKFGSWTFDGLTQGFELYLNTTSVEANYFQGSAEYKLTTNTAVRNERFYDCCVEPYLDITFTLGWTKVDPKKSACEPTQ